MAIPDTLIDQIQEKTDIVEVISRYLPLKKFGRNYKAPCPFHNEKTPSFIVSPDKQIYHCFGCGAGGNVFSFLMKHESLQFPEVIEMLAKDCGVVLPKSSFARGADSVLADKLYNINELACRFFQAGLGGNKTAGDYIRSRGVSFEALKKFKIGFAPDSWDALITFFKKNSIEPALLEKAGLVVANDKGGHYDRFRNRLIFPIIDLKGRVVGFGARVLDSSLPKYLNSPETPIYSKGRNLYGLNFSKDDIKKSGHFLVVEGYLDFIVPYQAGITNIIATLGTALTADQIKLLKRFAGTAVMVYDPDEAGEAASLRNLDLFISEDVSVYIAELPAGFDPDSYIRKFGVDEFLKLKKSSKNLFDYKLSKLSNRYNINTPHGKMGIAAEMLPTIARINNAVLKATLIKKLADCLAVDEESIKTELKKVKGDYSERRHVAALPEARQKAPAQSAEITILAMLMEGGSFIEKIKQALSPDEFRNSSIRDIVSAAFKFNEENKEVTPSRLINHFSLSPDAATLITEAVSVSETIGDKDRALVDCIAKMKSDSVKERKAMIQDAIRIAHSQKDDNKVKELVAEYNELVKAKKA
ncbi:MAG: DNA primase [Candidatus Omnitrophica bacterium]|nr:DNA primase [Candidatus Omnitrophota bacterium]